MSEKGYVYCHDCDKLIAICFDIEIANKVSSAYFRKTKHNHTVGIKSYFRNVYPDVVLEFEKEKELRFNNHYNCISCKISWSSQWDCMCDDKCPSCNNSIGPYKSEDI